MKEIKESYIKTEPQTELLLEEVLFNGQVFEKEILKKYTELIEDIPTGVNTWMKEYPDIVESSDNLAIVKTEEKYIRIAISMRSSEPEVLEKIKKKQAERAEKWRYRSVSALRDKAVEVWKKLTGEEMKVEVIHAGLECGAIYHNYPDIDFISLGPDMQNVHTPEEKLDIASTEKIYNYVVKLLEELK